MSKSCAGYTDPGLLPGVAGCMKSNDVQGAAKVCFAGNATGVPPNCVLNKKYYGENIATESLDESESAQVMKQDCADKCLG